MNIFKLGPLSYLFPDQTQATESALMLSRRLRVGVVYIKTQFQKHCAPKIYIWML